MEMPPAAATIQSLRAGYQSAQEKLAAMVKGPDPATVQSAQASLQAAEARLQAELQGPTPQGIASATAAVQSAQEKLNLELKGPDTASVKAAEVALEEAEQAAHIAQEQLDATTVKAPFTGAILALNVHKGDTIGSTASTATQSGASTQNSTSSSPSQTGSGTELLTIANPQEATVEVNINQIDVPNIKVGQQVQLSVAAFPNQIFKGTVSSLSDVANNNNGVITRGEPITFRINRYRL
jgi:HlyD family secretion protein